MIFGGRDVTADPTDGRISRDFKRLGRFNVSGNC